MDNKTNASRCDRCGEVVKDADAGFSPGLHEMAHDCGGTWRAATVAYTTNGSVRGSCGHQHSTVREAVRCVLEDQEGCERQTAGHGYSDRRIVRTDGAPLTEAEQNEMDAAMAEEWAK